MVARLGEVVGHAIAATDRKRALMSDEAVELEFRVPDVFEGIDADVTGDGTVVVDHTVPLDDGEFAVYGRATADARTGVTAAALGVADYGSVVLRSDREGTEPVSLYVDRHVAVVRASDVVPDMPAAFERLGPLLRDGASAVLATGPSATADMGALVKGAHGPKTVHVVVLDE